MKKVTKVLSVLLTLVMLCGMFSVLGVAADPEVNLKYTVLKMNEADVNGAAGVYKLTLSVKTAANASLQSSIIRVYYDKTLFAPVCTSDGSLPTTAANWRLTAALKRTKAAITFLGDCADADTMFDDAGNETTDENNACMMNQGSVSGNSNWTTYVRNIDASEWGTLDSSKYGLVQINQDPAQDTMGVYAPNDYEEVLALYFYALDTSADVTGAEFGFFTGGKETEFATAKDGYLGQMSGVTSGQYRALTFETVNAVVEETTIVNPLKGQIRFDKKDGAYAGTFDVRALATITEADFKATFTDAETAEDMIKEIGFVFASGENVGTPDMAGVKALVENGTALSGYKKKTVDYISTGATNVAAGNYVFSCIVEDIPEADKADNLVAVGYIAWDSNNDDVVDTYNYYPAAQTISFNALYTAHYGSAFPQA